MKTTQAGEKKMRAADFDQYAAHVPEVLQSTIGDEQAAAFEDTKEVRAFLNATPAPPVLYFGALPLAVPNNVTVIKAPRKSSKSATIREIITLMLNPDALDGGTGMRAEATDGALLLFDTEQAHDQLAKSVRKIVRAAGFATIPDRLRVYSLRGLKSADKMEYIKRKTADALTRFGKISGVFLDHYSDLNPRGVMEAESAQDFAALLCDYVDALDCPLFVSIHVSTGMNGEGTKGRGHNGREIEDKAYSILLCTKDKKERCVFRELETARDSAEGEIHRYEWNDAEEDWRFMRVANPDASCASASRKRGPTAAYTPAQAERALRMSGFVEASNKDATIAIQAACECGERTAEILLAKMSGPGGCLAARREGRKVIYGWAQPSQGLNSADVPF